MLVFILYAALWDMKRWCVSSSVLVFCAYFFSNRIQREDWTAQEKSIFWGGEKTCVRSSEMNY